MLQLRSGPIAMPIAPVFPHTHPKRSSSEGVYICLLVLHVHMHMRCGNHCPVASPPSSPKPIQKETEHPKKWTLAAISARRASPQVLCLIPNFFKSCTLRRGLQTEFRPARCRTTIATGSGASHGWNPSRVAHCSEYGTCCPSHAESRAWSPSHETRRGISHLSGSAPLRRWRPQLDMLQNNLW